MKGDTGLAERVGRQGDVESGTRLVIKAGGRARVADGDRYF